MPKPRPPMPMRYTTLSECKICKAIDMVDPEGSCRMCNQNKRARERRKEKKLDSKIQSVERP